MKKIPALWLIFIILASSLIFILFIPTPAKAAGISPPTPKITYITGDWIVNDTELRENETIVLTGNLSIQNGGSLTFRNVTLKMNPSSKGEFKIEVERGGTMIIEDLDGDNTTTQDASVIESNTTRAYMFWVRDGSNFTMRNSEIHDCGAWGIVGYSPVEKTFGLYIETDNATIDHNLISYNYYGIALWGSDALISNNTITWNDDTGIDASAWSNATIENNWITWSGTYGITVSGVDNTPPHPWPSNPIIVGNVITDTGRGTQTAVGIQVDYDCRPLIKDTKILRSTEDGLYSGEHSTPTLINVTIDGGNYGIASSSTRYVYI